MLTLEEALQEARKEKTFLVKLGRSVTDEVIQAWSRSIDEDEIVLVSAEKYSNDVIKATVTKGTAKALKHTWQAQSVQPFDTLVNKDHEKPNDSSFKNIRRG